MLWSFKKNNNSLKMLFSGGKKSRNETLQQWEIMSLPGSIPRNICKKVMILPTKRVMHYLAKPNPDHQKCIFQTCFFVLFFFSFDVSW